jgi:hypothetical protein
VASSGLEFAPMGMSYGAREPRGGAPTTPAAMRLAADRAARIARELGPRSSVADVFERLAVAIADPAGGAALCSHASRPPTRRRRATSAPRSSPASSPRSPTTRAGAWRAATSRWPSRSHRRLPDGVELRHAVRELRVDDDGVTLAVDGPGGQSQIEAAACVLAVPLPHARSLLEGHVPYRRAMRALLDGMAMGDAAKLHVALSATRRSPSAVLDVPGRWWSWTAPRRRGDVAPLVHCFAGTRAALVGARGRRRRRTLARRASPPCVPSCRSGPRPRSSPSGTATRGRWARTATLRPGAALPGPIPESRPPPVGSGARRRVDGRRVARPHGGRAPQRRQGGAAAGLGGFRPGSGYNASDRTSAAFGC